MMMLEQSFLSVTKLRVYGKYLIGQISCAVG